jgi:hypothetical protein
VAVTARLVCREARLAARDADIISTLFDDDEGPAREALRLAARAELLRRDLEDQDEHVPDHLQRAITALLAAARDCGA